MLDSKPNLIGKSINQLQKYFVEGGELSFRAKQLSKWLYQENCFNFDKMSNFNLKLRNQLANEFDLSLPKIALLRTSIDGTTKWLLNCGSNVSRSLIECVFIPEKNRGTLCISSQIGCALDCAFCATGQGGFNRNLLASEIIAQVIIAKQYLQENQDFYQKHNLSNQISNIVFMGMGEPLLNIKQVFPVVSILLSDFGYNLSKRKVTISTAGVTPGIYKLSEQLDIALAISLHAPNNNLRDRLVPLNKKYPLEELIPALQFYLQHNPNHKKHITLEYILIDGINDSVTYSKELLKFITVNFELEQIKVNLIPFNSFVGTKFKKSSYEQILRFQKVLTEAGVFTFLRKTRGADIAAACGQLVGDFENKIRRIGEKI